MIVEAQVPVRGSRTALWAAITDIANAPGTIKGIRKIEIVEKPAHGLVGLKWKETRLLFGKPATVEKWITKAVDHEFYETRAEDGGFVFLTTMRISDAGSGGLTLTGSHASEPQGFGATLMSIPMRLFFKGVVRKAALQDLEDIKAAVERTA